MSGEPDTRALMWQFDCVPMLVTLMHGEHLRRDVRTPPTPDDIDVLRNAADALLNMVAHHTTDDAKQHMEILK
jgi:hypothetical protein